MCSHYEAPTPSQLLDAFGVAPDGQYKLDLWPGYSGPFIRNRVGDVDEGDDLAEALVGVFGLLPHWAKDQKLARRTYNARSETVGELPSFRSAWSKARHCIIPAAAIYEPDWRSGKAVPTRISRKDGRLLGIAGLWEELLDGNGDVVHSFTMLTINADDHPLMSQFHRPGDERRMVVILPAGAQRDWLSATAEQSRDFLGQYPADRLVAESGSSES
ncbi:SOS response-associated peptidase [Pseudomonas aeruginosa]